MDSFIYSIQKGQIIPPDLDTHGKYKERLNSGENTLMLDSFITQAIVGFDYELLNVRNTGSTDPTYYRDPGNYTYYYTQLANDVKTSDLEKWYTIAKLVNDSSAMESIEQILKDNGREIPSYVEAEPEDTSFYDESNDDDAIFGDIDALFD